ncbi:MAG: AglZ/HisF2 family acetamidino modification protein [Bacteroidetes bacterium]|nr:AglZ/HisF2 family acetamidino modification protein [Bacteroidota bacterium]
MSVRVIPSLLISNGGLVKSVRFKDYKYIGDPINAVKIFNDKEVDEIVIIDIDATRNNRSPNIEKIQEVASEAFMPLSYGGGITKLEEVKSLFYNGVEKVIINKSAHTQPSLITETAKIFGSQSVIVSIDVKKSWMGGYKIYTDNGKKSTQLKPEEFAKQMQNLGAGEILLNNIDRDGTFQGYDTEFIERVSSSVSIPLIALGGAANLNDFKLAKKAGASAVSAGSMFVFMGQSRDSILINYPSQSDITEIARI